MRVFLCVVVIFAWAGCTPPAPETAVDSAAQEQAAKQAFREMAEQWDSAPDCEALLPLVTDDYIRYEPNRPAVEGKQAFLESCRQESERYSIENSKNVIVEVRLAGDWAWARGTWSADVTPKDGGEPFKAAGKWMDIRERQPDGSWKFSRVAGSDDAPWPGVDEE